MTEEKRISKIIRVYKKNTPQLDELKNKLSNEWGRQASYADAVNFLLRFYEKHKNKK